MLRSGLACLFEGTDLAVVAEAADGDEAVAKALAVRPDIVVMDVRMAETDGLLALERIRSELPQLPVVMLSTYDNPTYVARAVALGAQDFLLKGSPRHELLAAIQRAARGEAPAPDSLLQKVRKSMEKFPKSDVDNLVTSRELQVMRHVALGLSNREVGQSLGISVDTVKEHVQKILRKLAVKDRTQLAVWAVRRGLV